MVAVVGGVACLSCGTAGDAQKFIFDSNRKFVSNLTKCARQVSSLPQLCDWNYKSLART